MPDFITVVLSDKTILFINPDTVSRIFQAPDGSQAGIFFVDGKETNVADTAVVTKLLQDLGIT